MQWCRGRPNRSGDSWLVARWPTKVMCISAFGTIRHLETRDKILDHFLSVATPAYRLGRRSPKWTMYLESEAPDLLNELGPPQSTSVDVLLVLSKAVFAVAAKPPKCEGMAGPSVFVLEQWPCNFPCDRKVVSRGVLNHPLRKTDDLR